MKEPMWSVRAGTSLQAVLDDPACPPLLARVLRGIHPWQNRNETLVGRTLRAPQLTPQWVAALLALGAVVTLKDEEVVHKVELEALIDGKVKGHVEALHIPSEAGVRWGEARVARTPSDDPIVAAFAVVRASNDVVREARVALTGASSAPVRLLAAPGALAGHALEDEPIRDVASAVMREVEPKGDYLGGADYRRAMAGVLTRRALEACRCCPSPSLRQETDDD